MMMSSNRQMIDPITNVFLAFLGFLAGMAALVASGVLLVKYGLQLPLVSAVSGVLYLLILACMVRWAANSRSDGHGRVWIWALILVTAVVKTALVVLSRNYLQLGDRATFIRFVETLAAAGLGADNLASLTSIFDYRAWLSRAFPVALSVRWLFGSQHVFFYQLSNVFLSTLSLYLFYELASGLLKPARARAACVIYALFPLRLFYVLEYTHQFQVECCVLAASLVLVQLINPENRSAAQWGRAVLLGALLFLLRLQIGWDVIVLTLTAAAFLFTIADPRSRSRRKLLLGWFAAVCMVYGITSAPFDRWAGQHEIPTSGVPGFMARGWSIESLGEYDSLPEHLELAAPSEDRAQTMYAYILSQLYYHPRDVALKLLPAKMAKYFLAGYATDMDETFRRSGMPVTGNIFTGLRLIFAPVFLFSVLLGCMGLVRHKGKPLNWLLMALLPVMACGVFVLFGETSPKYSFYIHPHMTLIAVSAASLFGQASEATRSRKRSLLILLAAMTGLICLYFFTVLGAAHAVRSAAQPGVFKNMRNEDAGRSSPILFERTLLPDRLPAGAVATDTVSWPAVVKTPHRTVLYLWPVGDIPGADDAECRISVNGREVFQASLRSMKSVNRADWVSDAEEGEQKVELTLRRAPADALASGEGTPGVRWGYIHSIAEKEPRF